MPIPAAVLFDIDGTLVDHDGALRQGLVGWLTSKQLATEEQCLDGLVGLWDDVAERHFPAFRAGQISFQDQRRRRLRDFLPHLGLRTEQLGDTALDGIFDDYPKHYEAAWRAFGDAAPCLTSPDHVRLAVLSNGDQAQQEDKLRRTHLDQHFEAVMTSSTLGAAKPSPEAFRLACERLAVDPRTSPTSATGWTSTPRRRTRLVSAASGSIGGHSARTSTGSQSIR